MKQNFKVGDRVVWKSKDMDICDAGKVVEVKDEVSGFSSIYPKHRQGNIWVKWDSDGKILHVGEQDLTLESETKHQEMTEEAAVMLLLSKGYTVTGPKK